MAAMIHDQTLWEMNGWRACAYSPRMPNMSDFTSTARKQDVDIACLTAIRVVGGAWAIMVKPDGRQFVERKMLP